MADGIWASLSRGERALLIAVAGLERQQASLALLSTMTGMSKGAVSRAINRASMREHGGLLAFGRLRQGAWFELPDACWAEGYGDPRTTPWWAGTDC